MQKVLEHPSSPAYWSECAIQEYMLRILPGDRIKNKVLLQKKYLFDEPGAVAGTDTEPYITIANFFAKEEMEGTLIKWIQRICGQLKSFSLLLNDFIGMSPDSVYIGIQNSLLLQGLVHKMKIIDGLLLSSSCPPLHVISKPQLNSARELTWEVYEKNIKMYKLKNFSESFIVNEVNLYKRGNSFGSCKHVNVFRLMPETN